jgi:AhpD family alkylhydroperoxidase
MKERLNPSSVAPEGLAALLGVEKYLQTCGLEPRLLALVKTRVSQMNGCAYCLHMHTEHALRVGERDVRIFLLNAWHESGLFSPRERAALAWAESLTNIAAPQGLDDIYSELRSEFSDKEMADLSIAVAMINAWNRLMIGARTKYPTDLPNVA